MERIGLIGIGNVGSGFARMLREAGYPLIVLDRDPKKMEPAIALGAEVPLESRARRTSEALAYLATPSRPRRR